MPRRRRPHLGTKPHVFREEGFILVAVLLLIALATVLIVTTSGVARIESKAVANSMREEQARQNALFGLDVALAQLQREAGPDQRVTATAEILNTNSAVPSPVNNPFWTGVWKTYNPDWERDPARLPWNRPQPLDITMDGQSTAPLRPWSTNSSNTAWLVSMPSGPDTPDPVSWNNWTASNAVLLASNWGTNSQANTVYAPLVMVTNVVKAGQFSMTNVGSYAYWVSDEGVKAKISLCDTNANSAIASSPGMMVSKLLHFTAPAAPSVTQLLTNFGITGIPDLRGNTNMAKLTTMNGLQFVTNGIPAFSNNLLSADLTVHGYGVLCDVRRGGLKQDLTAAFESSQERPDGFNALLYRSGIQDGTTASDDAQMAWRSATMSLPVNLGLRTGITNVSGQGPQIDGMRWQSLYNFYNLYKARWVPSPLVSNAIASGAPQGLGTPQISAGFDQVDSRCPVWNARAPYLWYSALSPIVVCQSIRVTLDNSGGSPRLNYYPMLALYNPYSVAVNVRGSFTLAKNIGGMVNRPIKIQDFTWGGKSIPFPQYDGGIGPASYVFPGTYSLQMTATNGANSSLKPGEIRAYGLTIGGGINIDVSGSMSGVGVFSQGSGLAGQPLQSSSRLQISGGQNCYSVTLTSTDPANGLPAAGGAYAVNFPSPQGAIDYNTLKYAPTAQPGSPPMTINSWPGRETFISSFSSLPGYLPGNNNTTVKYSFPNRSGDIGTLMGGTEVTIASITERLKSTLPARFKKDYYGVSTPVPIFMGNSLFFNGPDSGTAGFVAIFPSTEIDVSGSEALGFQIAPSAVAPNASTLSWGSYPVGDEPPNSGNNPRNNVVKVLRDIPFAPLTSLGQFMHAGDYYNENANNNWNVLFPRTIPYLSIGGGFCCPETGPYFTSIHFNGNSAVNIQNQLVADNSYLANEALFDTYYFSTVPPTNGFSWGSGLPGYGPYASELTPASIAARQPLPNSRHVFYSKNGSNPVAADLQDEGKAAANLLVDGAFNVNSTSVVAWKSLITSLNGSSMMVKNVVNGATENRNNLTNPIPRFWDVGTFAPNLPWDGTRCLTEAQVDSLAREIVRQVKARGPFLSMGDFLNRRLPKVGLPWGSQHLLGALQAAIENTATNGNAADVNNIVHDPSVSVTTAPMVRLSWNSFGLPTPQTNNAGTWPFVGQIASNSAVGIPGYLMQQDLLQAFAPVMSVRSDTFLIRFYGDTRGVLQRGKSSPEPEARVWGEAVVQRLPEYYDQEDPILASTSVIPGITRALGDATPPRTKNGEILSQPNRTFGRRFKVVSLRWLSPEEVAPSPN